MKTDEDAKEEGLAKYVPGKHKKVRTIKERQELYEFMDRRNIKNKKNGVNNRRKSQVAFLNLDLEMDMAKKMT